MPALGAGIYAFLHVAKKGVDTRDKPAHDEVGNGCFIGRRVILKAVAGFRHDHAKMMAVRRSINDLA
jgi:hypothetical protein